MLPACPCRPTRSAPFQLPQTDRALNAQRQHRAVRNPRAPSQVPTCDLWLDLTSTSPPTLHESSVRPRITGRYHFAARWTKATIKWIWRASKCGRSRALRVAAPPDRLLDSSQRPLKRVSLDFSVDASDIPSRRAGGSERRETRADASPTLIAGSIDSRRRAAQQTPDSFGLVLVPFHH